VVGPQDGAANGRCSELLRSPRSRTPSRRGRTRAIGRLSRRPPGPCLLLWPGHDRSARPDSGPCAATAERWPRNGHKAGRTGCIFSIRAVSMKMQPPRGIPGLIPFERTEKCQPTLHVSVSRGRRGRGIRFLQHRRLDIHSRPGTASRDRLALLKTLAEHPGEHARQVLDFLREEDEIRTKKREREDQRGWIVGG
jgi:hypothetical protein